MKRSNNESMLTTNKKSCEIASPLPQSTSTVDPNPNPTEVDVNKNISAQDLKSLKKQDPFLYYSIPGVREAKIRLEDDDVNMHQIALNELRRQGSPASRTSETVKVKRCKRHSFECHVDSVIGDLGLEELLPEGFNLGELGDILSELY